MDFVNFLSGPVQAASDSLRGAIIEGAREGFSLVQQHLSAGVTKTFDEGAGIIQQGLKQTFDEGARTIQEGLNDALKQTFKDGACTIQQGVQQGFRQAFDKGLTDARGYIKKKDDLATVFKDFLECYLKAEAKDRAVRWWQSFLPLVITVAVFGGSITFTLIIQEIADPVELNAKFSSETVRTFISLAWLLFVCTLAVASLSASLLNFYSDKVKDGFEGKTWFIPTVFHILSFLLYASLLGAFMFLSLAVVAYVRVVGWIGVCITSVMALTILVIWLCVGLKMVYEYRKTPK